MAEAALFLAWYGLPWKKPDRPVAWQLWIFSAGYGAEALLLLLLIAGVLAPVWVFLLVFAVMNVALLHQLILLWRVRHAGGRVKMAVESTQSRHPWRATTRTVAAAIVALLPVLPEIVNQLGLASVPVVGSILAVAAGATRVLAMPSVEAWMHRFIPWLAAQPAPLPDPQLLRRWPDDGPDQATLAN